MIKSKFNDLLKEIKQAEKDFKLGKVKKGSVNDLLKDLNNDNTIHRTAKINIRKK